jgi:hypothetical protein
LFKVITEEPAAISRYYINNTAATRNDYYSVLDEISKETFDALKNVIKAEDYVTVSIQVKSVQEFDI